MKSIDPRVRRLPKADHPDAVPAATPLDQLGTFEVFVQPKEGKPFQHEGIVHASDKDMAWVLAKEAFTRRFSCISLCVADTRHIHTSQTTEGGLNAYDLIQDTEPPAGSAEPYEIYHMLKRGKQHIHAGTVIATDAAHALASAKRQFGSLKACSVWALRTADIRFTTADDQDMWRTLPEKKFRDASEYKGGDKLKTLLERLRS